MSDKPESEYTPWSTDPVPAMLKWDKVVEDFGYLHYIDPDGQKQVTWVSRTHERSTGTGFGNIWKIDVDEVNGLATVSPSIHYVGFFHTPNPVVFRLVEKLEGQ